MVVDCGALQEELLQSELFGHERGAFTGADRAKPGLFEVANGGTIFLDEIGEVSQATQVKLLRVLDTSTFRHVGGTTEIKVDARVVVATNRDLATLARQRLFREDLYYRLSTITVELPPLRQRPGDVELLAEHFLARLNERYGSSRRLAPEAMALLRRYDWPGNVRELLHVIESAAVVCDGAEILPLHLPAALRAQVAPAASAARTRRSPCPRCRRWSGRTSSARCARAAATGATPRGCWESASAASTGSSRSIASPDAALVRGPGPTVPAATRTNTGHGVVGRPCNPPVAYGFTHFT